MLPVKVAYFLVQILLSDLLYLGLDIAHVEAGEVGGEHLLEVFFHHHIGSLLVVGLLQLVDVACRQSCQHVERSSAAELIAGYQVVELMAQQLCSKVGVALLVHQVVNSCHISCFLFVFGLKPSGLRRRLGESDFYKCTCCNTRHIVGSVVDSRVAIPLVVDGEGEAEQVCFDVLLYLWIEGILGGVIILT